MNEVMNVFNYGQTEYELVTHITHKVCGQSVTQIRNMNKDITKHKININHNCDLISMLYVYAEKFPRFIKTFHKIIKSSKWSSKFDRGHMFTINGYIISKAFLSYIIQNKKNIYDMFNYTEVKNINRFKIHNVEAIFKFKKNVDGGRKYIEQIYKDVEIYNYETDCVEKHDIEMKRQYMFIKNNQYYISTRRYSNEAIIVEKKYCVKNYYIEFKKTLTKYFESVNVHNDNDFDGYLDGEVQKLMRMNFDQELKQLQS